MERCEAFLFERVFVETDVDTDGDGRADLIAVFVRRPSGTLRGEKVPAVLVANPYLMTCNEDWYNLRDVDRELKVYPTQDLTEPARIANIDAGMPALGRMTPRGLAETSPFDEASVEFECISEINSHFNERGYASVYCGGLGTLFSDGLTMTGQKEEILAFCSVIDWLCGRSRAFTDKTGDIEIRADWCTGSVAMSGKSYLGTMCIAVASTGIEGLRTIIPEAGISNWYEYYRSNGLALAPLGWQGDDLDILAGYCFSRRKDPDDYELIRDCFEAHQRELIEGEDRDSGNYSDFWEVGNYLHRAADFKASALIIQGLNDWNVKPGQGIKLFRELEKLDMPRKLVLHQGEHVFVYNLKDAGVTELIDRWLDYYLKGIDTGVTDEPKVLVESNLDQLRWAASESFPPEGGKEYVFPIYRAGYPEIMTWIDDLRGTVYLKEADNLSEWRDELVLSERDDYHNRLKFVWDPFADEDFADRTDIRISGTTRISFSAALDRPAAILSAMLVDIGSDRRITAEVINDDCGAFMFGLEDTPSPYKVITRGWLNAQNYKCNYSKELLESGKYYDFSFEMVPMDYRLMSGHKLALILYGVDAEATVRSPVVTTISVKTASIRARIYMI